LIVITDSSHNHIKFPRHPANAGLSVWTVIQQIDAEGVIADQRRAGLIR
jgi:hypothetical protein